ncbi:MAG: ATP-binding cassette domain-containing protein [Buchnera aphidicola (Schlechtendalia peitan)]
MSLIYMQNACFSINNNKLLNNVNFQINKQERICLVGRNGTGKSTFLNIITKKELLDHGLVIHKNNIRIKYLTQTITNSNGKTVYEFVCEGIGEESEYLKKYFYILNNKKLTTSLYNAKLLLQLKEIFNEKKLWKKKEKIDNIIKFFGLNSNSQLSSLSGGWLKKVELGRILVSEPDLIILDEPTNHLDIISIHWLEKFLIHNITSVLFVSHNRSFINNLSTKIIYLTSGNLVSWTGNYNSFLNQKSINEHITEVKSIKFEKKLEEEKLWINSGVKARSTKNENRIKQFKNMLKIKDSNQNTKKSIEILINESNYRGNIFFKLNKICFKINEFTLINNFSDVIQNGEKIALIGINGSGKSTLLKLILRQLKLNSGEIYSNSNVKIAYFDQKRTSINFEETVLQNLSYLKEEVLINDKKYHTLKYLEKFLFSKDKVKLKAKELSGGEINKLLLAKVFLKKSNVLILDEPTNDLDLESLDILEISLRKYKGVILLVSHDKTFIENVANKYWNFENNGIIKKYLSFPNINNFSENLTLFHKSSNLKNERNNKLLMKNKPISKNLNYNLKKELKNIPKKIEKIENNIKKLQNTINNSFFLNLPLTERKEILIQLKNEERNLEEQFLRWEYLESCNNNKNYDL